MKSFIYFLHVDVKLTSSCFCFKVRFYEGVVELSLYAALKRDPQGLALHFYRNGEPRGDVQGEEAFIARYHLVQRLDITFNT